ncbi:MAG: zinc ribbon domain-containing protein [Bryobacteraceae bacterium]
MAEFCTCGAQLPPDARFCHKCGKPQRDEPVFVEEQPESLLPPPPVATLPPASVEITFHNSTAVRIALFAALLVYLLLTVSVQVYLTQGWPLLWLVLSGLLAVYLYHRRTGQHLSVLSGARMGWLTGLFAFAISVVLLTLIALALKDPTMAESWRQQMSAHGATDASAKQMLDALHSPSGLMEILLGLFVFFTLLPMVGGALGAKFFSKGAEESRR